MCPISLTEKNNFRLIIIADVFRILLTNGIDVRTEIARWASELSETISPLPLSLKELKGANLLSANEIIFLLQSLSKGESHPLAYRLVAGKVFRAVQAKEMSIEKAIAVLEWLSRSSTLTAEEKVLMSDIHIGIIEAGDISEHDQKLMAKQLNTVLKMYEPYDVLRPDDWAGAEDNIGIEKMRMLELIRVEQGRFIHELKTSPRKWWKRWL